MTVCSVCSKEIKKDSVFERLLNRNHGDPLTPADIENMRSLSNKELEELKIAQDKYKEELQKSLDEVNERLYKINHYSEVMSKYETVDDIPESLAVEIAEFFAPILKNMYEDVDAKIKEHSEELERLKSIQKGRLLK